MLVLGATHSGMAIGMQHHGGCLRLVLVLGAYSFRHGNSYAASWRLFAAGAGARCYSFRHGNRYAASWRLFAAGTRCSVLDLLQLCQVPTHIPLNPGPPDEVQAGQCGGGLASKCGVAFGKRRVPPYVSFSELGVSGRWAAKPSSAAEKRKIGRKCRKRQGESRKNRHSRYSLSSKTA